MKFVFLVATLSGVVSATLGVTSLFLGNYIRAQDFASVWFTWWLGDTIGSTLLTPLIVLWSINCRVRWNFSRVLEAFFGRYRGDELGACRYRERAS